MALTPEDIQTIKTLLDERFDQVNQRFEAMDKRFEQVNQRFDVMEKYMDAQFQEQEKNLELICRNFIEELYGDGSPQGDLKDLNRRVTTLEHKRDRLTSH